MQYNILFQNTFVQPQMSSEISLYDVSSVEKIPKFFYIIHLNIISIKRYKLLMTFGHGPLIN